MKICQKTNFLFFDRNKLANDGCLCFFIKNNTVLDEYCNSKEYPLKNKS